MSESLKELRGMPYEELIEKHDYEAKTTGTDVHYYLAEIARRDQDKQTKTMVRCTWAITGMTFVILLLTVANLVFIMKK